MKKKNQLNFDLSVFSIYVHEKVLLCTFRTVYYGYLSWP